MFEAKGIKDDLDKMKSSQDDFDKMSKVVAETLLSLTKQYGQHTLKCIEAYTLRGGWEPWFQVELTLALNFAMNNEFHNKALGLGIPRAANICP